MGSSDQASGRPVIDRITELSDAEQAYIARIVALTHPEAAEEGLAALATYRLEHPGTALLLLGADSSAEAQR